MEVFAGSCAVLPLVAAAPGSRCLHTFKPGKDDTSPLLNHCEVSVEGEVMALAFNADGLLYVIAASSPDKYRLFVFDSLTSSLVEPNDELSEFVASIPPQKQDFFDFSEFFKQKNCQNVRYQKFFDKVGKRCGAQNEQQKNAKKIKVDAESARKGKRIKCGADTVIKNVLPFLKLE